MAKPRGKNRSFVTAVLAVLCVFGLAGAAMGQVTTGSLAGRVVAQEDRSVLPGVAIEAIHVPTGTRYSAVTQERGRFTILNVRVGGPYTVSATLAGFKPQQLDDITIALGETRELEFELQFEAVVEQLVVTAEAEPLISADRMGSESAVSGDLIAALPTVRRQIQDYARLNPYFNVGPWDETGTTLTVAGRNNRYNSIQIDGAVNNDLFGLAATGTPGGQADTQPVALDAVQELQLVVSPYDIKQGGFTGGAINAITRSGSNNFVGTVYGSTRDPDYVSDRPGGFTEDRPIADFGEDQYGLTFGGRILRDRLFFFLSAERNTRSQPTGISADGSTLTQFYKPEEAARFHDYLISEYDYDPGTLGDFPQVKDSDLLLVKLDLNVGNSHQVTLRHNFVDAASDVVGDRSTTAFRFDTAIYALADETNSTVFQLNSVFGSNTFNSGRIGYQTIRDVRSVGVVFPTVDIGPISRRPELTAGTERFSGANSLDQDILEVTDDLTFLLGSHTLTVGTSNQLFDFKNLYLPDFYGFYRFDTVDDFMKGIAEEYSIYFATGDDPRRPTSFGAEQYGLYVGDEWRVTKDLTLTLGLRGDYPVLSDEPSFNQSVYDTFGIDTSEVPTETLMISPRIGFNWNLGGSTPQQLRGGVGIFAGRTPYVWISNVYGNTGVEQTNLSASNVPFNPDPYSQPKNFPPGTGAVSVDAIDPNFEFPQIMRATLGYDREMLWGIRGSLEAMYTQTQEDVFYYNMNKVETGTLSADGRPTYKNFSNSFRDIPYLTNTGKGEQLNLSLQLQKRFDFGLYVNAWYAYMDAKSTFDATSSRAISNWQYMPTRGDIYEQELARTSFEYEDRFNFMVTQAFNTGRVGHTIGLFYSVVSGQPYSVLIGGDPNKDGYSSNDLMYIPASQDEIVLSGTTWEDFQSFLSWTGLDKYQGQIAPRNVSFAPWNRSLDFHYDLELPISVIRTKLTFDILNLLNLIDTDKGAIRYVSNQTWTPFTYSVDSATGKPKYTKSSSMSIAPGAAWTTQDLRSRWQLKIGLRLSF
jgi:hypothetical protein